MQITVSTPEPDLSYIVNVHYLFGRNGVHSRSLFCQLWRAGNLYSRRTENPFGLSALSKMREKVRGTLPEFEDLSSSHEHVSDRRGNR